MSLPRYPEYKDSGAAWLGAVPRNWAVHPLKHSIARIESGVSVNAVDEPAEIGGIGVLKTSCVYTGSFAPSENKAVVAEELSRVACPVQAGTLIVSRMNTPALVGAAGFVTESRDDLFLPDRLWQVHFHDEVNPAFIHYWTASPTYRAQVEMACAGTSASMQNLSQDSFLSFTLPLPSTDEQTAIATFLDRETGKIDALIAEQEKLLTLLAEKRQATISHAVTKGLNPDAPMKDSGVVWLGEVPEHWPVVPLRWYASCRSGDGVSTTEVVLEPDEQHSIPTIGGNGCMGFTHSSNVSKAVLAIGRVGALCGNVHQIAPPAWITDNALVLESSDAFYLSYLEHVLRSRNLNEIASKTAQPLVTGTQVREQRVPCPPAAEQLAIALFVDAETSLIDKLTKEASCSITLLKERRSALIAAAVTGQIDVRGLVTKPEAA